MVARHNRSRHNGNDGALDDKVALAIRDLDVFIGINGLVHRLSQDRTVALVLAPHLVRHLNASFTDVDFRFWVANEHGEVQACVRKLQDAGYRVLMVDKTNVEATYKRLSVSPRVMISDADFKRDDAAERKRADATMARHPSYVVTEGEVNARVIPDCVPRVAPHIDDIACITDVAQVLDRALHLHSEGGPLLVLADILNLRCARFCHATHGYNFPFRRVTRVVVA